MRHAGAALVCNAAEASTSVASNAADRSRRSSSDDPAPRNIHAAPPRNIHVAAAASPRPEPRRRHRPERRYAADGHAVKELLKVATTLYEASNAHEAAQAGEKLPDAPPLASRMKDIKIARSLAADITERGARLHDLLGREEEVKGDRQAALRFLDTISSNMEGGEHAHVQRSVEALVERCQEDIEATKKQCSELSADEKALDAKIRKKRGELERHEKRLKSLRTVRPAFMDEYEKLERELQKQYARPRRNCLARRPRGFRGLSASRARRRRDLVAADYPRRGRGAAATCGRPPRTVRVVAAAAPPRATADYPRRDCGTAATRRRGLSAPRPAPPPRPRLRRNNVAGTRSTSNASGI